MSELTETLKKLNSQIYANYTKMAKDFLDTVKAGKDINVKVDDKGNTMLHIYCMGGKSAIAAITMLLEAGADVNATNYNGETPLLLSVESDNAEVCQTLIENGAKLDIQDNLGRTPLKIAEALSKSTLKNILLTASYQ